MDQETIRAHQHNALVRFVAQVCAMIGLGPGKVIGVLPRPVQLVVLSVLRPAEAACRRLIVVAARGLVVAPRPFRGKPVGEIAAGAGEPRIPCFPLFDPQKRFGVTQAVRYAPGPGPCITDIWSADFRVAPPPLPTSERDERAGTDRLCRRLLSLQATLDTLPKQARRLARAMARRALAPPGPRRLGPMRPGLPPGHRTRGLREVDDILSECHTLALRVLAAPDTS